MTDANTIDREEAELLLPWYVAGTLDASDKARMDAFLSTTSEFDAQLAAIRQDRDESIAVNETARGPASGALDRLMADIDNEPAKPISLQSSAAGVFAGIENFLKSLSPGRLGFAAMAAALLIAVQAGLLGSDLLRSGSTYETAGGQAQAKTGTVFLIQFKSQADIGAVTTFLESLKARIVSGPDNGGFFKIKIGDKKLDATERGALVKRMEARTEIVDIVTPSR